MHEADSPVPMPVQCVLCARVSAAAAPERNGKSWDLFFPVEVGEKLGSLSSILFGGRQARNVTPVDRFTLRFVSTTIAVEKQIVKRLKLFF